jgi:AraC-like DNA-binding protein
MLSTRTVLARDGITVADVACREAPGAGHTAEWSSGHMVVFVRRGCFTRRADGSATLLDPTVAYCANPGEEERYDHPGAGGDDCTAVILAPELVPSLWGGDEMLPSGSLPTPPRLDLEHRLLLACGRRGDDPASLVDRAVDVATQALTQVDPGRVAAGRPASVRARRAIVDATRGLLSADPGLSVLQLAGELAVSPHHLSRIFHAETGRTITRHRIRLRVRSALERLAEGERDLARLAAEVGLADQSHLCRVIRSETGYVPSALRQALA